jgi:hypothetical protein
MSLAEAIEYVSHPGRWTIFSYFETRKPRRRTKGLLDRLTPEQRDRLFAHRGAEASGDQSLPKRNDSTQNRP